MLHVKLPHELCVEINCFLNRQCVSSFVQIQVWSTLLINAKKMGWIDWFVVTAITLLSLDALKAVSDNIHHQGVRLLTLF